MADTTKKEVAARERAETNQQSMEVSSGRARPPSQMEALAPPGGPSWRAQAYLTAHLVPWSEQSSAWVTTWASWHGGRHPWASAL